MGGRGTVPAAHGRPTEVYLVPAANLTVGVTVAGMDVVVGVLGRAWWVHVYVSGGLVALVGAAALCCLARAAHASSRLCPPILAIHALVLVFAALRAVPLMHDPYGAHARVPPTLGALVWACAWPCLTLALALLALIILRTRPSRPSQHTHLNARPHPRTHLPRILATLCTVHVGVWVCTRVGAHLTPTPHAHHLKAAAQATAATWGGAVGVCLLWAAWRLERSRGGHSGQLLSGRGGGRVVGPAHVLGLAAGLAQVVLAALHLYLLAAPTVVPGRPWAWWARASLCRALEVVAAGAGVGAAALLRWGHTPTAARRGEGAIFSVLSSCGRDGRPGLKGAHVFPEKQHHALGHALKPPTQTHWCAPAATDLQVLCGRDEGGRNTPTVGASMLVHDGGFVRFRTQGEGAPPPAYTVQATTPTYPYPAHTMPRPRYYCPPSASLPRPRRPSSSSFTASRRRQHRTRTHTLPNHAHAHAPTHAPTHPRYEVAPYQIAPPSTHTYATPIRTPLHAHAHARSTASSVSEDVQIDYLTDQSQTSSDAHRPTPTPTTLPLTLPLTHIHTPFQTHTPTPTPTDSLTGRGSLLTKLVGGSMGGYAPLHIEDTTPPTLHTHPRPRWCQDTPMDTVTPL